MFDYYVFDLDGVLVDVRDSYKREVFDEVGDELGREFDEDEIRRLWYGVGGDRKEIIRSWGYEPREFWEVFDALDTPERRVEHTFAYEDARVVRELDAPKGLVTHSPPALAHPALEKAGLADEFDSVVCCSYELGYKPEPAPIRACLDEMGASPDETVMIGDSVSDVKGAWNAGLTAGHIDRVGHRVEADINIENLDAVREFA
ncbi:MAG: HAD family hydrolase [Halobacteriales archaeon]|nr:HAD family hydrolase [Halobacteriales archaeon]